MNVHQLKDCCMDSKTQDQKGHTTRYSRQGHEHPYLIAEDISGRNLLQEGHPGPKGLKVFQKDPVTLGWGLGPHQGGCRFLQGPSGNDIGHKTRTGQAHQDTGEDDPGIGLDFQGIDNGSSGIGIANKGGDKEIPQDGTKNSSHNGCQKSIEVKFLGDLISLEAQGLKGPHIISMLFHHPGHGG